MLLLENDSNPEVRRAVLSCIAPSALTLPKIYRRTRDVKEKVRKLAYQVRNTHTHMHAFKTECAAWTERFEEETGDVLSLI